MYPQTNDNNERLEFLGDAILHTIVSDYLYRTHEHAEEGELTQLRTCIENRKNLNAIAHAIGLDKYIKSNTNLNGNDIPGNALEALIGAIYLDKGLNMCEKFVQKQIIYKKTANTNSSKNDKQHLDQWCNSHKCTYEFVTLKDDITPENRHNFVVAIRINGKEITQAAGSTKKEAEQTAAGKALRFLNKHSKQIT